MELSLTQPQSSPASSIFTTVLVLMSVLDSSSWIFLPHESYFGTGTIIVGWCEWLRSTLRKFSNVAISPNCYRVVHRSKILTTLTATTAWFPSSATKLFPLIPPSNSSTFTSCCRGLDWWQQTAQDCAHLACHVVQRPFSHLAVLKPRPTRLHSPASEVRSLKMFFGWLPAALHLVLNNSCPW